MPRFARWLALAGAVVVADFATKAWVLAAFRPAEADAAQAKVRLLCEMGPGAGAGVEAVEAKLAENLATLERYRLAVDEANIPRVLPEEAAGILQEIAGKTFTSPDGTEHPYLTPEELRELQTSAEAVRQGVADLDTFFTLK